MFTVCVGLVFRSKYVQFPIICSLQYSININIVEVDPTDLKIDWIWHLLLKIEAEVIGPTLPYFSITKSHFSHFYSFYTLIININGMKTRKNGILM